MASHWLWRDIIHKIILLDTSSILSCFEFSIDLEGELRRLLGSYTVMIPSSVIKELEVLSNKGDGVKSRNAKASLLFIKKYDVIDVEEKNTDDSLIFLSKKIDAIVVTNDNMLRKRLKDKRQRVIFLRSKKQLEID
ncbi:MAG: hypothetical protein R6V50_03570 [Thermoplasmatota archaeon]